MNAIYSVSANGSGGSEVTYCLWCHIRVWFPLTLKFLLFFLTSYILVFIAICNLFSLTFILILTCRSLCWIRLC